MPRAIRAVAAEPWNAGYWDTLGEAFCAAGMYDAAAVAAGCALELSPRDGDANTAAGYYEKQVSRMIRLRESHGASAAEDTPK